MDFDKFCQLLLENSAARSYSCLMLECPQVNRTLKFVHSKICPCDVYDSEDGHGLETHSHITILYGIEESKPSEVFPKLEIEPIKFKLTGLSLFQNEKYDVLKFSVDSPDLHRLNRQVREKIKYENKYPKYIPHLTCAYLNPGMGEKYTNLQCKIFGKELKSNVFVFADPMSNKTYKRL